MRIKLTHKQVEELRPYFDRVQATAAMGTPGMLVAQLRFDAARCEYTMEPAFLDPEYAQTITERGRREIPGPIRLEKRKADSCADAVGVLASEITNLRNRPESWAARKADQWEALRQDLQRIRQEQQMTTVGGKRLT